MALRSRRILFARIGWMRQYNGAVPGDEKPIGGGRYNKTGIGHELYNFRDTRGTMYGYFQPHMASKTVALERIDATARNAERIRNVLVVFVAREKAAGQVVVGWYDNATVFRHGQPRSPGKPRGFGHFCSAPADQCRLVPALARTEPVPVGKGGMGQSNVWYTLEADGSGRSRQWLTRILNYIDGYDGDNVITTPTADVQNEVAQIAEKAIARAGGADGQGFAKNLKERLALEDRAMKAAKAYFKRRGYSVEDVSKRRPFDLVCTKRGRELHLEVKGTTTGGDVIILTNGEVKHVCDGRNNCGLFVFHSMSLNRGKAYGGKPALILPWRLKRSRLTPISFTYAI